jgi:hypothetical protein
MRKPPDARGRPVLHARIVPVSLRPPTEPAASRASVRRAWQRYLAETRDTGADEYERVEERAWRRLASNLAALGVPVQAPDSRR